MEPERKAKNHKFLFYTNIAILFLHCCVLTYVIAYRTVFAPPLLACANGDLERVKLLHYRGAFAPLKESAQNPSFVALKCGAEDVFIFLFENDYRPSHINSALLDAADQRNYKIVDFLLENGANPRYQALGMSVLHYAARDGNGKDYPDNIAKSALRSTARNV